MKICLVTAFPPSRGGLSEYGFHIARELRQNRLLSLTVLADTVPDLQQPEPDVIRCWNFNDRGSARKILRTVREINPDVVWFNLLFTTFGHDPLAAFQGLTLPLRTRLGGFYTHVTLHHLMDFIDLEGAGVRFPRLYRVAGRVSTKMLLLSNSVSVLMPAYRNVLLKKYGGGNVHFRAHGILAQHPEHPDFSRRGNPTQHILAFGKWGTYKRLEPLIEAFQAVRTKHPDAKLVIAGGNHPRTPGYVESLAAQYSSLGIEFTGYVPEEKIADLFRSASIAVMPYSSATGASGVAHLACAYGVPIISSNLPEFVHMATEEGMAIKFYQANDVGDLAEKLGELLESRQQQRTMAIQNFSAAIRMTMPSIIHEYVRHFVRIRQARALRPIRWWRKLPPWVSRSYVGRTALQALMTGSNRLRSRAGMLNAAGLVNTNGHGGGHLRASGGADDLDPVAGSGVHPGAAAAGDEQEHGAPDGQYQAYAEDVLPLYLANTQQPQSPEGEEAGIERTFFPASEDTGKRTY